MKMQAATSEGGIWRQMREKGEGREARILILRRRLCFIFSFVNEILNVVSGQNVLWKTGRINESKPSPFIETIKRTYLIFY